tara:strand:+ start:521 stop:724 length:204 start_codon:yes stop_codon:yes gene_type:complete
MIELEYLYDRVKIGIDAHPSDIELEKFVALAKEINPELSWAVKGCQYCVNELVRFVFENVKPEEDAD